MFLTYRASIFHFVCCLTITCSLVSCDDIPTMLWNIKGNALHMKPVSALGHKDKILSESLKNILHEGSNILVFAVKYLSLEDLSANDKPSALNNTLYNMESFLDSQPYMLLQSVKDPLNYIHKAHCGVQEIVVDNKIDDIVMQSVSTAMQRSCVVILHISDDGVVSKEDELKTVFLPAFENSNRNIVGIFTGVKSSWGTPNNDHKIRNLLATAPSDDHFVNYTGCIFMYAEAASVRIGKESNNSVNLSFPVDTDGSLCDNSTVLQLNFKTSGALSSVTLKLTFERQKGSWKTVGVVNMTGEKAYSNDVDLESEFIEAPVGFSYSCGNLVLKPKNRTYDITITMDGFQIQPYEVGDAFSDSFDCVPFFTIPIWMGIFVSVLFIVIMNIGIYALFSVHTMDRFDDPKGKTISVATAVD